MSQMHYKMYRLYARRVRNHWREGVKFFIEINPLMTVDYLTWMFLNIAFDHLPVTVPTLVWSMQPHLYRGWVTAARTLTLSPTAKGGPPETTSAWTALTPQTRPRPRHSTYRIHIKISYSQIIWGISRIKILRVRNNVTNVRTVPIKVRGLHTQNPSYVSILCIETWRANSFIMDLLKYLIYFYTRPLGMVSIGKKILLTCKKTFCFISRSTFCTCPTSPKAT